MDLVRRVERFIEDERLFEPEDGITVAVSGGPDSAALLHILFLLSDRWGWKLSAAHLNHGFRGAESDAEAGFVAEWAAKLGLPCEVGFIDMPAYIRKTGMNPQAASRDKRYGFLLDAAQKFGAGRIALGHHADDQAETVLMRLVRGTGPSGLAGIPLRRMLKNVELIRPLLRITKMELEQYCRDHRIPFVTDSSNAKRDYTRNRIRLDVMPELAKVNPRLTDAIHRLASVIEGEDHYLEEETKAVYGRLVQRNGRDLLISREQFRTLHLALQRRLIKLILDYLTSETDHFDFVRMEAVRRAVLQETPTTAALDIGFGVTAVREYDLIRFAAASGPDMPFHYEIGCENGDLALPGTGIKLEYRITERRKSGPAADPGRESAYFDPAQIRFPLTVRSRQSGDRMEIWGLNGSKKVKDIFIDAKVPPRKRSRIPLLVDADGRILWIPGYRRSAHAPVTEHTEFVFHIKTADE